MGNPSISKTYSQPQGIQTYLPQEYGSKLSGEWVAAREYLTVLIKTPPHPVMTAGFIEQERENFS